MALENYYNISITTSRVTTATGTMLQTTDTWADNLTILGAIRPLKIHEQVKDNKMAVVADYRMYCSVVDILETDRVVADSITYEVKSVKNITVKSHHLELDIKRIF